MIDRLCNNTNKFYSNELETKRIAVLSSLRAIIGVSPSLSSNRSIRILHPSSNTTESRNLFFLILLFSTSSSRIPIAEYFLLLQDRPRYPSTYSIFHNLSIIFFIYVSIDIYTHTHTILNIIICIKLLFFVALQL